MSLGKIDKRIWLTIDKGRVIHTENGERSLFSYVDGRLEDIYKCIRYIKGSHVPIWVINMRSEEGELYSISFSYSSGTFKSIILALASEEELTTDTFIRIEPYKKGQYTNVMIFSDGVKLDWVIKQLPPLRTVIVDGKPVKDDSERMRTIGGYVDLILKRLKGVYPSLNKRYK